MKKYFCLLVFASVFANAYSQNIYSALHHNEINGYKYGRPSKIEELNTFYTSKGKEVKKNILTFDPSGMPVLEERFDSDGKLTARLTYVNDTLHKIVLERVMEHWVRTGYQKETAVYSYDEKKHLVKIDDRDANGNTISVTRIVNNGNGDPVELEITDASGNAFGLEKGEYHYDQNMVVTTVYSANGRLISTDSIKIHFSGKSALSPDAVLNEQGDIVSASRRSFNGAVKLIENTYEYDRLGNCTSMKEYEVTVCSGGKKKRVLKKHLQKRFTY